MSVRNETIEDIEKKLRELARAIKHQLQMPQAMYEQHATIENKPLDVYFTELADRIKAAWKRETEKISRRDAEAQSVGNAAKLREALEIAKKAICNHARANHTCDSLAWENSTINANCGHILCAHRDLCEAKTAIQKALAEPARNCDVGTAEEQRRRCYRFCSSHICNTCPLNEVVDCTISWGQMPYTESEAGTEELPQAKRISGDGAGETKGGEGQ